MAVVFTWIFFFENLPFLLVKKVNTYKLILWTYNRDNNIYNISIERTLLVARRICPLNRFNVLRSNSTILRIKNQGHGIGIQIENLASIQYSNHYYESYAQSLWNWQISNNDNCLSKDLKTSCTYYRELLNVWQVECLEEFPRTFRFCA